MMSSQGYQPSPAISSTVRPMSEQETQAMKAVPKSPRNNAIGLSVMAMLMAVMVNFVEEPIALVMPLLFSFVGLGLAVQARKSSGTAAQALSKGTVTDVRGIPRYKGPSGWDFGVFTVLKDGQLKGALSEGAPATVSIVPEVRRVLSVNSVPLRRPIELRAAPGFEAMLASCSVQRPVSQTPSVLEDLQDDLPPPPEDWGQRFCPNCGNAISEGHVFCRKCGSKLSG